MCVGVFEMSVGKKIKNSVRCLLFSEVSIRTGHVLGLQVTFCSYPKGGTFTTKLDLKN
jgi:hypothetical protein